MKFTVSITCDTPALTDRPGVELARILRAIADSLGDDPPGVFQTIFDRDGNDVGRFAAKNHDGSIWEAGQ